MSDTYMKLVENQNNLVNDFGNQNTGKLFTMKGSRPKPNNLRDRTPGPGSYPIYGDFVHHPDSKEKGWVFPKAVKKISKSIPSKKAKFFTDESEGSKRHNTNILGPKGPSPGPGSYNVYNSGIGSGFGPPPPFKSKKRLNKTFDGGRRKDNRFKRKDHLYQNLRLRKIKGVSFGKAKRKDLSNVDPDIEVGPADYQIKSTVAQLQPWEVNEKYTNYAFAK